MLSAYVESFGALGVQTVVKIHKLAILDSDVNPSLNPTKFWILTK